MFRWIIGSSLKYRYLVALISVALVAYGMDQLRRMPVDVFPEFAPPKVEIQTESPGMSTVEVEELITIPLEQALAGTPGLNVLRSKTVEGLSSVVLWFKPGTDIWVARQAVTEQMALAMPNLPVVATVPLMLPPLSSTSRMMKIGMSSKTVGMIELSTLAFWKIRPRLMKIPGVANVALWGERLQQWHVQVDPDKLRALGITLNQVAETTSDSLEVGILSYTKAWHPGAGGWVDTPNQRLALQHILPIKGPNDLAQVPIKVKDGVPIRLADLGVVKEDHPPLIGDAVINGDIGIMMIVEKFPWGNSLQLTRAVEEAIAALKPGLPGIEIDTTIFRPATYIEVSMENLTRAMILGAILVVLVLVAFLFEWRVALISLVAIPLSLVAALLVLYLQKATMNVMVLAGFVVALGSIVDDAIIDIENVVRRLRQNRREGTGQSTAAVILEASLEIRSPIWYATLIIVVAVTPVIFLGGLSGAFFEPMALAYSLALLASMVVALTVTPALALMLLDKTDIGQRDTLLVRSLHRAYEAVLSRIMRAPRATFVTAGVLALPGLAVWPFLGQELLPAFKERDFLMHWVTKPGTSRPEMVRVTQAACRELMTIPGVRNCGSHIGRAIAADEVYGINFTENWVSVDPKVDYGKTLHSIEELVDGYPGIYRDVQTYLKERIKEVLTGGKKSLIIRLYGPELHPLRTLGQEVRQALAGIHGLVDLHAELQVDIPQIVTKIDLEKAARYGIKPGDVHRAAGALVQGVEIGDIYKDNKAYDVSMWTIPEKRASLTTLRDALLDTADGGHVRLAEVADVQIVPTPNHIEHEHMARRFDVSANVRGRDLGAVAADVERTLKQVKFPLGYHAELIGEEQERRAAQRRLLGYSAIVAVVMFLLLHAAFGNWRLAALVFLLLPAALIGGVLAAYVGGGVLSLGSLVGFLTVLGIAARNGILLIHHCQHLEQLEGEPHGPGLVLRGARERLSPILMTTLCTGLALVPLVYWGNLPGHEIEYPLAVVVLGGLVTSTLLTLFVIPPLYLRYGSIPKPEAVPQAAA